MSRRYRWLSRAALSVLLTRELNDVNGCEGAKIIVGASRNVGPGQSNWSNFLCEVPEHSDPNPGFGTDLNRKIRHNFDS